MHRISSIAFPSFAAICGFAVAQADAAVIGIDDFSGDETVITFEDEFTSVPSRTFGDVTVSMLVPGDTLDVNHIHWDVMFENLSSYSGGHALTPNGQTPSFRIDFASPVKRAGLALANQEEGYTWTVRAFDSDGVALDEEIFSRPEAAYSTFVGFEFATAIASLEIIDNGGGWATVVDDIRYEIPEPAALALLGGGILMMVPRRGRR